MQKSRAQPTNGPSAAIAALRQTGTGSSRGSRLARPAVATGFARRALRSCHEVVDAEFRKERSCHARKTCPDRSLNSACGFPPWFRRRCRRGNCRYSHPTVLRSPVARRLTAPASACQAWSMPTSGISPPTSKPRSSAPGNNMAALCDDCLECRRPPIAAADAAGRPTPARLRGHHRWEAPGAPR